MQKPLWITYAWADNKDGDFDYLVGELKKAGIDAHYDRVALVPGRRLWEQIADRITKGELSGWAYLLTKQSLASEPCREELSYALKRALETKGAAFPLIGLISGVSISEVPPALSSRLCVDLRSPDWIEQVRAGIENRPPIPSTTPALPFKHVVHHPYIGQTNLYAIEFLPRLGERRNWRIAVPVAGSHPIQSGVGPTNGQAVTGILQGYFEGTIEIDATKCAFYGSSDVLTPGTSAYAIFENNFPTTILFGWADAQFGMPKEWFPLQLA